MRERLDGIQQVVAAGEMQELKMGDSGIMYTGKLISMFPDKQSPHGFGVSLSQSHYSVKLTPITQAGVNDAADYNKRRRPG